MNGRATFAPLTPNGLRDARKLRRARVTDGVKHQIKTEAAREIEAMRSLGPVRTETVT